MGIEPKPSTVAPQRGVAEGAKPDRSFEAYLRDKAATYGAVTMGEKPPLLNWTHEELGAVVDFGPADYETFDKMQEVWKDIDAMLQERREFPERFRKEGVQ
jgi:hypothetical protein